MKFVARLVLAFLGTFFLVPSFLTASEDVRVVPSEVSQCLAGVMCVQETGGDWTCSRDSGSIHDSVITVGANAYEFGKHLDSSDFLENACDSGEYPALKSVAHGRIVLSFARIYVGTVKIQV